MVFKLATISSTILIASVMACCCGGIAPSPEVRQETRTPEEIRKAELRKCFRAWDGSHLELVHKLKQRMHDADSFQHVKTEYIDNGDTLTLMMDFRGKNSFGAYVLQSCTAIADSKDGTILWMDTDGSPLRNLQKHIDAAESPNASKRNRTLMGSPAAPQSPKQADVTERPVDAWQPVVDDVVVPKFDDSLLPVVDPLPEMVQTEEQKREGAAQRKLDLAKQLIKQGKSADSFLKQIINDHPDTDAAREAASILRP